MANSTTHIALVDDHTLLRSGLAAIVNSFEGYRVLFEADNGKDLIDQLRLHPAPDIILLDINMPEMDGQETADWIRINLPEARVLVLSVLDTDSIIISMIKKGARGYILKDSKPAAFKQALDHIRDSGFYMNELVNNKMFSYVMQEDDKVKEDTLATTLTPNERTFLKLVCSEMTYKEIAGEMGLSPRTVDGYRDDLLRKLKVQSRIGLVIFAIKHGIYHL